MKHELVRVTPVRAANVVSILYALMMLVFAVMTFAGLHWMPGPGSLSPEQHELARANMRGMLVLYPLLGLVLGWIGAYLGAHLYNAVAARLGGIELELAAVDARRDAPIG